MDAEQKNETPCLNCRYIIDKQFYYFQTQLTESARYTSTIMTVAYVSLLSLISFTHKQISIILLILICLCATISILLFTIHEIWSMTLRTKKNELLENLWAEIYNNKININEFETQFYLQDKENRKTFKKWYKKIFNTTVIFGLLSAFFLFLGCSIFILKPAILNLFQHFSNL